MEFMYVLLVVELVVIVLVAVGLWFGLAALRRRSGGSSAGWAALEAAWAVADAPKDPIASRQSLMVGKVLWRNCVAVSADPRGLHLAVKVPLLGGFGKKPVLIPWEAFRDPEPAKLFWGDATLWHLGTPDVATLTLPVDLETQIRAAGGRLLR